MQGFGRGVTAEPDQFPFRFDYGPEFLFGADGVAIGEQLFYFFFLFAVGGPIAVSGAPIAEAEFALDFFGVEEAGVLGPRDGGGRS